MTARLTNGNGPSVVGLKQPVIQMTGVTARVVGQLVEINIKGIPITMDFIAALKLSQILRVYGKRAKINAGVRGAEINCLPLLTDAAFDEAEQQSLRDATALFKK